MLKKKIVTFSVKTIIQMTEINNDITSLFPNKHRPFRIYLTLNHDYLQKAQLFAIFEAKI